MVKKRTAFSMIELIFAIVVIAIAVMALPMMVQTTGKGIEGNLVQEAIFASAAKLNEITSYPWDENSTEDGSILSRVIWTSATDCNNSTKLRSGHIEEQLHRRCLDDNYSIVQPTSPLGMEASDNGVYNDIDDFNDVSAPLYINKNGTVGSAEGYKTPYTMDVNISYAAFGSDINMTKTKKNIKEINITIIDPNTNLTILKVHTYSANIGEIDYYHRSF